MSIFFEKIFSLGTDINHSTTVNKKIRLLNKFCFFWFLVIPLWMTEAILLSKHLSILIHLLTVIILCIILYLNTTKRLEVSTRLFFISLYILLVYFSYFGSNLGAEFCFILLTPLGLVFYDKKKIILSILVISFLTFWLPHYILRNEVSIPYSTIIPNQVIYKDPHTKFITFLFVYLIVAYFKKLNNENEMLLVERNSVLSNQQDNQIRFFVNIAHEIRTPITIIKGNAEQYIQNEIGLNNINLQVKNLDRLVNDIIDISKMESNLFVLHRKEINLNELITKVYNSFETNFTQKQIDYSLRVTSSNAFIVNADEAYLEKVFSNLLSNSLKFTPKGKSVEVLIKSLPQKVLVSIADTGVGILKKNQSEIFKRFYQVNTSKDSFGGSGIGLFFSKNIITMHGGEIDFASEFGKGTTFTISLPFKRKITKEKGTDFLDKMTLSSESTLEKEYDILLVEDNQDMQNHIENLLEEYSILFADNGSVAMNLLEKKDLSFHLIITDYMMPEMNGLEFIRMLQDVKIDTPVIVLSALSDQFKKQELFELGIYDYIHKPFNIKELKAGITNCIDRQSSREELRVYEKENNTELLDASKLVIKPYYDYIYNNSHDKTMSVQKLCDEFIVSQSTLYRKIKNHSGMNPQEFIKEIKLAKVRHLVESGNVQNIKYILNEIGWSNSTHLYKMYQKRYGINLRLIISK
jgi:signal transduction histidine kinase/DNA-binding response OmpR family regulator